MASIVRNYSLDSYGCLGRAFCRGYGYEIGAILTAGRVIFWCFRDSADGRVREFGDGSEFCITMFSETEPETGDPDTLCTSSRVSAASSNLLRFISGIGKFFWKNRR